MKYYILVLFACILPGCASHSSARNHSSKPSRESVFLGDPMVLNYDGLYYLYGTRFVSKGILVYKSSDMKNWEGPAGARNGFALRKGDVYGKKKFMGAYVLRRHKTFYLFYVTNQQIGVATSHSPLGPFTQKEKKVLNLEGKAIAPHVFIDDNGEIYLYYTKLDHGNKIYMAELNDDLRSVKENTARECLHVTESWENTAEVPWTVAEGPAVLKHEGTYYLFYTANDFRNPDYNVGYATAPSPMGPWTKYEGNPILNENKVKGAGSCEFVRNASGKLLMFYHTHNGYDQVFPRKTAYSECSFVSGEGGHPDIFEVENKTEFVYQVMQR